MTDKLKGWGAIIVSVLIFVVLAWWLIVVAVHLGDSPKVVNGAVVLDTFQRSKDVLLVILPLTTTAVGFWLGNQGAGKAEQSAQQAVQDAERAGRAAAEAEERMHDYRARALLAEQQLAIIRNANQTSESKTVMPVLDALFRNPPPDAAPPSGTGTPTTYFGDDEF